MGKIFKNVTELIGGTPLLDIQRYCRKNGFNGKILAKLEYLNPAGSIKDRIAKAMIESAEAKGLLRKGSVIIEPTSGNTGIGLAAVAAFKGYKLILTMPETMSVERRKLLKGYGAEIVLTEGSEGMQGAVEKAKELAKTFEYSYIPGQFENPENPKTHYNTTGPEIWDDTQGKVDFLVCGVGTGGTLSGTGGYLKGKNTNLKVIAVEPFDSPLISQGKSGPHGLQGIGANFIPSTLDKNVIDEIVCVKNEEAYKAARELAKTEGILAGISSGAALYAAGIIASREENSGKVIAVILPDTGDRYLSTPLFED